MPISRYQIRNPYGLADPDLYRSADRDDPEAILEGVAMAGLVGILRQLGDLAEFAAEIFRDLHEDVMATAARGHGLMIRVQQVEAEFPSIERALLSQTIHSNFAKNAGVEWHANLKMEHNLITTGDMQRFIMDSYEECRGPPRLFLLDKFDIAGAGACLKRYSDPSFFKTEFSHSKRKKAEVQRETKARKIKKRGARWHNGDTSEMFSTHFNSTLRQLFSDENESDSKKVPIHAVKLKRKHLNGSSFNSITGRSYMECVLETCSPKHAIVHENSECNMSDLASSKVDFASKLQMDRNWISSPNGQEVLESSLDELDQDIVKEQSLESLPKPTARFHEEILSSTLSQISQNYVTDDDERRMEARETEVEEISSDIRQADETDESLNEQSKIEDDVSKTELDKLPPSDLQVGQKGALFDIESRIEICLDGYRSAESEEEKNTTIYPEDQRDAFDGKNKAEVIDDGYGTDNVARNSSFIHPIDQKELSDGKSKTEANDDVYGSDNAEKNHAVIYTTDHDGYEFYDAEKNHSGICPVDQKDSLPNGESKPETSDDGHGSNDEASELDNYMDALTTMESEMETDTESRAKHEKSFIDVVTTETYYDTNEKRYDVHPDVHPVEDSSTSYDLNSSLKKQRSSCSDSSANLADVQILEGKGIASLDAHEKFNKSPKFDDAMPRPIHRSSSFVLPDKSPSPSNGDAGAEAYLSTNIGLTEVHDATPDERTSCDGPGTKSPESFIPSSNNDRISETSHFVSLSGEISWSSCITDAAATLIHSSSGASLNEVQLVATDPSEISFVNIEAMGNHSGDDILLIPEVSSHCPQMVDLGTATFAKSSIRSRMLDSEDHNASSESGLHFSDNLNMPHRMKDAEEDCPGAAELTSWHVDVTLGDLQADFESHLPLQTPESAVPEKALTDDSCTASVGENLIMLDLPSPKTSPVEDQLLSLAKCDIDACSAILLPPECLVHVRTDPIDMSPCGLNSEKESTGRHSSCAVGLPNSIELPEHEQTSDILPYKPENSDMKSHNNILDQADASAVSIETETSLFAGWERLCGATENEVKVVLVNLPLKSPVDDLPVEFSVHSDDMATRSAVGLSICNDEGPTIHSRAPSDHPRLLEEESLPTEVTLDQHKIEMSEAPNQEDNIAFNGQNLTALSDNEANELLMHATDPAATAEPCQPDCQDLVVSENRDGVHHTMPLQGTIIHPHSSGVLDVPLLSMGGSQDLEQKLRESNQPVGPESPDLCHPCKDEKDAVSLSTHFISEPSIPPEQILDAVSSHDQERLEPADDLFERKKSLEEMVPPVMYEADCFNSHPDSSLVDQLIQQMSESKLKPESLVVATSSIMNEPVISSLGVPRSTILKSEVQMQLPPSHYYQTSESPTNLLNSAVAGTPSPTSPSIGMLISETANELQPNMPMLGFPLSEPNLQSHEMEDMPPLPPLPPLEWRIGKLRHNSLPYGGQAMHSTDPFLPPQIDGVDRTQQHPNPFLGPQTVDTDNSKQPLSPFGLMPAREDEKNQGGSLGSITVQPPNSYFPLPNTDNKKSLLSSQPVEEVRKHPPKKSVLSVIVEDEKCPHDLQTSEDRMEQSVIPLMPPETKEDKKANDKMQSEHTRPRDPLIEAVAAHDRSMLRKVSKRFQNETMPKSDERDSFLGQIRAKSFNLKPTTSVKPIIQGPRTNLNVVAILEKANAIRQAFAGSDEDNDSDSWSDS